MSDPSAEAREIGYALFNNVTFAYVVMAADQLMTHSSDGTTTIRQIAARLRLSDSVVRPVVARLLDAKLLDELPRAGPRNGPRPLHRRSSERWPSLLEQIVAIGVLLPEPSETD